MKSHHNRYSSLVDELLYKTPSIRNLKTWSQLLDTLYSKGTIVCTHVKQIETSKNKSLQYRHLKT